MSAVSYLKTGIYVIMSGGRNEKISINSNLLLSCRYFIFKPQPDFYKTLNVYIEAILKTKKFKWRLFIGIIASTMLIIGIILSFLGDSIIASQIFSITGVILNIFSFSFKSLR